MKLIYKIDKNCILYYQFTKELESNFKFEDRVKKLCKIFDKKKSDLVIQIEREKKKASLNITWKDGSPVDFDFSGININDLDIAPREFHESNINKYLNDKVTENLKAPLNYEYFFVNTNLFIEIATLSDIPLSFRVKGLELLNDHDSLTISCVRDMVESLVEDVCYVY